MNDSAKKPGTASRLSLTRTLRAGGIMRWRQATIFIAGTGAIGQRFSLESVLSGAHVMACDFDTFAIENGETQFGTLGISKVESLVERANRVAPGHAIGLHCDIRHVGIGAISKANLLIDCTDDPTLALPLTRISNGLGIPLMRVAIDGSGAAEMGRVTCSHGGGGHSCQICSYRPADLMAHTPRTPCPAVTPQRVPTIAGGAIGTMIAGAAVLQAQRLVSGNEIDLVLDRELLVDMSNMQMISLQRLRCADCLSGHVRWDLNRLYMTAKHTTLPDLFHEAENMLGNSVITLEPFAHPFCTFVTCQCGQHQASVGTRWAEPPCCPRCGTQMSWAGETVRDRISRDDVRDLGIGSRTLAELGLPVRGAMFVARAAGQLPLRIVLD